MKKLTTLFSLLCLTLALTVPASALEYDIDGPGDPEYGKVTSIEIIHTADGGAMKNAFIQKLEDASFVQSMSRKGNCWDNAPQESFFGHMKDEIASLIAD